MNQDTRSLILRLQSEDLTALWIAPADNNSEIDATVRVYRRQINLLDRHLKEIHQTRVIEDTAEAANHETPASLQITDGKAPILTEQGDVHQLGGVYAHHNTPSPFASAASTPALVVATSARPLPHISACPVVRLPSVPAHPIVRLPQAAQNVEEREKQKKLLQEKREAGIISRQEEEAHEEIERKERIRKMDALKIPREKMVRNSSSGSTGLPPISTTDFKRSADHLATPGAPPSKKQANAVVKKEPECELGLPAPKNTIKDKPEDLLQSSRSFSSPNLRDRSAQTRGPTRGIQTGRRTRRPPLGPNRYQAFNAAVPMASNIRAIPSIFVMPGMAPAMPGLNFGNNGHSDALSGAPQPDGFLQPSPQALSTSTALGVGFDAATPSEQKQMLGEALYPKIKAQQPEFAGKITGMILGMDNAELLHLTTDEVALRDKVYEALGVYCAHLEAKCREDPEWSP